MSSLITRSLEKPGYVEKLLDERGDNGMQSQYKNYPGLPNYSSPPLPPAKEEEMPKSRISWTFPAILSLCLVLLSWPISLRSVATSPADTTAPRSLMEPPRQSTNLTDVVQWDNYTLFVNDQRIFL